MGRTHYMTARCLACEAWLHPDAMEPHIDLERCRGHPWVEDIPDATLVAAPAAELLEPFLPSSIVDRPTFSYERLTTWQPSDYLSPDVCHGITIRSPIPGVPSRRWVHVALAAAQRDGGDGVRRAITPAGFQDLESQLVDLTEFVKCPGCHDLVKRRGLANHRARNFACRWREAAREVRQLWEQGWQDPYSVLDAPLKWTELRYKAEWRRRLRTVNFPTWTAVLIQPIAE